MRKMASIRVVRDVQPILGADRIVAYKVDGWTVVGQKDAHRPGDVVVYIEPDAWVPKDIAPFLISEKSKPRTFNGVEGERLRTVKLRGQISQGLIVPLSINRGLVDQPIGADVSEILNVQKWELPPPSVSLGASRSRGSFPEFIFKTDQERIQNLDMEDIVGKVYEVTEKLDGTSMTVYATTDDAGVCSRNQNLLEEDNNAYWLVARETGILEYLKSLVAMDPQQCFAVQGELCGPGIQGNKYKLIKPTFFVFDVFSIHSAAYLKSEPRRQFLDQMKSANVKVDVCPILDTGKVVPPGTSVEDLLAQSELKSIMNKDIWMEGLVYKNVLNGGHHFKAINNNFLLKYGE